jgi:hypothetical protein
LPDGWPGKYRIELLRQRAGELFIYASTACLFIGDPLWDPDERISLILQDDYVGQSSIIKLDEMYTQILIRSTIIRDPKKQHKEKLTREFRQIARSIVIQYDSLPVTALAGLLGMPEGTIYTRLRSLHSVLEVPKDQDRPMRLFHLSFRDFLLDKERYPDQFWIDEKMAYNDLFVHCIKLMSERQHLKKDMCNLRRPGALASEVEKIKLEQYLPLDIQYACQHWVHHLQQGNINLYTISQVHIFLQKHFLYWLEALSLIGNMPHAVGMVRTLESMLIVSDSINYTIVLLANLAKPKYTIALLLLPMIQDAKHFILYNRSIVEKALLQVYASALVFSPKMSLIRRQFLSQGPAWIESWPVVEENWSPSLQMFEGYSSSVRAITFLPNRQVLVSGSDNKTVWLWDTRTGALQHTLESYSGRIETVTFLPNRQTFVSG